MKGFDIFDAWTDDDPMFLIDHCILLCRLRPQSSEGKYVQDSMTACVALVIRSRRE